MLDYDVIETPENVELQQRLGDLAAGTVVISEQRPDYSASADRRVKAQWEYEATGSGLRAKGLTPEEYRLLSNYWARRNQLTIEVRSRMLPKLVEPILQRTGQRLNDEFFEALESYVEQLMYRAWAAETQARQAAREEAP